MVDITFIETQSLRQLSRSVSEFNFDLHQLLLRGRQTVDFRSVHWVMIDQARQLNNYEGWCSEQRHLVFVFTLPVLCR
jgi:hypothetical protein